MDVPTTIIAGRASPVTAQKIQALCSQWRQAAPERLRDSVETVATVLASVMDGAVSAPSTRLNGVDDHVVLRGNHTGLIWTNPKSQHVPPSNPIILDRLAGPDNVD